MITRERSVSFLNVARVVFWQHDPPHEDPNLVCRDKIFRDIPAVHGELSAHDPQKAFSCCIENTRSGVARSGNILDQRWEALLIAWGKYAGSSNGRSRRLPRVDDDDGIAGPGRGGA